MAQCSHLMQIRNMSGVATGSKTPIYNPLPAATRLTVFNGDGNAITFQTDDAAGAAAVAIAANAERTFEVSHAAAWQENDVLGYVSGNVTTQPLCIFSR